MPEKDTSRNRPGARVTRLRPVRPCPICRKPSVQAFHPFCSARCADIDLNRWLNGAYVIPARDDEDQEETGQTGAADDDDQYPA